MYRLPGRSLVSYHCLTLLWAFIQSVRASFWYALRMRERGRHSLARCVAWTDSLSACSQPLTVSESGITNGLEIFDSGSGLRLVASNNDNMVRILEMDSFSQVGWGSSILGCIHNARDIHACVLAHRLFRMNHSTKSTASGKETLCSVFKPQWSVWAHICTKSMAKGGVLLLEAKPHRQLVWYMTMAISLWGHSIELSVFCCSCRRHRVPWPANWATASPDNGKLLAVVGDDPEALVLDTATGATVAELNGHLDYSFAAAWHPNGTYLATANQVLIPNRFPTWFDFSLC